MTMYVYSVYPAISEIPQQLTNYLKILKQASFQSFAMVSSVTSAIILLSFLSVTLHK